MSSLDFERNPAGQISLDFCFACQVVWFDTLESPQLAPRGAPLDLEHGTACKYCASPISILDPDAVSKTLRELGDAERRSHTIDLDQLADALTMHPLPGSSDRSAIVGDLVGAGIAILGAMLRP